MDEPAMCEQCNGRRHHLEQKLDALRGERELFRHLDGGL